MEHPLKGVWSVEARSSGRPNVDRATHAYHDDGVLTIAGTNYSAQGIWSALGPSTVAVAALLPTPPGEGLDGWFELKGRPELSPDGSTFQLDGTISRPTPSGTPIERTVTTSGRRMVLP
mgnify:CR=1 FL=1